MSDTGQTPQPDQDVRSSLLRLGGGALGLVVLVALVFLGIGNVTRDETPVVADAPEEAESVDEAPEEEPEPEPDEAEGADEAEEPEDTDGDADEAEGEDAATEDDEDDADEGDADEDDADEDDTPSVEPSSVTVQVLDGYKQDGGAAADTIADTLGGDGYQVIARNDALAYDVTTVLYNPGSEDAAEQVAQVIGAGDVRPQSGNLSTAVDLHVVVGSDRG